MTKQDRSARLISAAEFAQAKFDLAVRLQSLLDGKGWTQRQFAMKLYVAWTEKRIPEIVTQASVVSYIAASTLPTRRKRDAMAVVLEVEPASLVRDDIVAEGRAKRVVSPNGNIVRLKRATRGLKYGRLVVDAELPIADAKALADELLRRLS